jgi:hypothetical protein
MMKAGDTVELKYQTKPGCLPEIASVIDVWWCHTGIVQYISIHCPKLGGVFAVRADTYEAPRANKASA